MKINSGSRDFLLLCLFANATSKQILLWTVSRVITERVVFDTLIFYEFTILQETVLSWFSYITEYYSTFLGIWSSKMESHAEIHKANETKIKTKKVLNN